MKTVALRVWLILMVLTSAVVIPAAAAPSTGMPVPQDLRGFSAALSPGGVLWAVWSADDGDDTDLFYSRWVGGGWLSARALYADGSTWDDFPSLAFAADGTPWVAWSSAGREEGDLYVSRWVGYRWSRPERVPAGSAARPRQPALAAAPDGGFWLAWIGSDGNDDEIYASHWDGLTWSAPERVGQDDADPLAYDTHPRLAVDRYGVPWLVWVSSRGLFDDAVMVSHWDGTGWTAEQMVSAPDGTPDVWPSLAFDGDGQPWVAWQDVAGSGADAHWRIYVARWQADVAAWSGEERVSSPAGLAIEEMRPSLGFDAAGNLHLAWAVSGGLEGVAYATRDGTTWSQPAWIAEQVAAETPILLPGEVPSVLWADLATADQVPLTRNSLNGSLAPVPQTLTQSSISPDAQCIYNRYVAWGDSITKGSYDDPIGSGNPVGPYPARLEDKLDRRVVASEVINRGVNGERVSQLFHRIGGEALNYLPQFPLIMEGTNDVTKGRSPSEICEDLAIIIDTLKKYIDIDGIRPWLSTVIPRLDNLNGDTEVLNQYIRGTAAAKRVPYADNWQAFYDYGDWTSLFRDLLHPNSAGMQVLADNWYASILNEYSWLYEDTTPPDAWIEPLPSTTGCGDVSVEWDGTDNVSWVEEYDVQYQINSGLWTNWLLGTQDTSATFTGGWYGDTLGFRVRGTDAAGNQQPGYSAPEYTQLVDNTPPYDVQMGDLPPAQQGPFALRWSGTDDCSAVAFDVQCSVGSQYDWQTWRSGVSYTSAAFDPEEPPCGPAQYGWAYYFRVLGRDAAGNESPWSGSVSTLLARFVLEGGIFTARHELVAGADVNLNPAALYVGRPPGHYVAYLAAEGNYDLFAARDGFETPLPMHLTSVTADMGDLDFVLPPLDNVVLNGDLEPEAWDGWQIGGTLVPTWTAPSHTGYGVALLGDTGQTSWLSQSLSIPADLTDATLSFLVRLDDDADISSTLHVELDGTPISHTQDIPAGGWIHVWLPVDAALGRNTTLVFTVSDAPAVRLDEVSLGSALSGGAYIYMPSIYQGGAGP